MEATQQLLNKIAEVRPDWVQPLRTPGYYKVVEGYYICFRDPVSLSMKDLLFGAFYRAAKKDGARIDWTKIFSTSTLPIDRLLYVLWQRERKRQA